MVCGKCFVETTGTIFYRKRVPAETIWQALKVLAEGLGIRSTARVFDVDPNTVETWLRQAAAHMEAVSHHLIRDLHLTQVQVDELKELLGQRDGQAQSQQKARAVRWIWAGIDPVSKQLLFAPHGLAPAPAATHQGQWLTQKVAPTHTGHGSGLDRPHLAYGRVVIVSGASLAASRCSDGLVLYQDQRLHWSTGREPSSTDAHCSLNGAHMRFR